MFAFSPPPAVGITPRSGEMAVTCAPKGQSVYKQEFVSGVRVHYCGCCFYNLWLYTNGCTDNGFKSTGALSTVKAHGLPRQSPGQGFFRSNIAEISSDFNIRISV